MNIPNDKHTLTHRFNHPEFSFRSSLASCLFLKANLKIQENTNTSLKYHAATFKHVQTPQ